MSNDIWAALGKVGEVTEKEAKALKAVLEYLRYFYQTCDFGPAHGDVIDTINQSYTEETGNPVPEGYNYDDE